MTVITGSVIGAVATAGVATGPAAFGAAAGTLVSILSGSTVGMAGSTLGTAAASGGVMGAVTGSLASVLGNATPYSVIHGSLLGAVTGAGSSAAYTAAVVGAASGPLSLLVLGADIAESDAACTFDCWKPILHDESTEPSNGMLLQDVIADKRIADVTLSFSNLSDPHIVLHNIWGEMFRIDMVSLPSGHLATHANKI
ncbi:uncharacterized protein LOC129595505 [Paramacrobiotus metropolitanus]|uniref:uncharacterized protein LOC129595505 n=1 Tax=Paramacrobiotus metropolitanus TaxID=2943436 RepID=UPI002445BCB0|nr:uncharacterized protein LOC129595505 [Paramacrobiotus metropolitanus]XP_055348516.1 uncharacterized protein LOC129595505 [Paramacrobiotus metropolitanus]